MRLVAPFGFYGSGNIGDEATLLGFGRLMERFGGGISVDVASSDPAHTKRVEPAFRHYQYIDGIMGLPAKLHAHMGAGYIIPGGTPLMDNLGDWPLLSLGGMLQHAGNWGKPAAFVGVGVEQLRHDISRKRVQEQIIPNVMCWSVRSVHDRDRLLDLGVAPELITVAADMAWLLDPADPAYGRKVTQRLGLGGRPIIGVNINAEDHMIEKAPRLFTELAAGLDDLVNRHGARVLFLFNEVREGETYDQAAADLVRSLMSRKDAVLMGPSDYLIPQEMMSIIAQCAMTISTRYHFCVFSALQGVPFLGIRRSDKVSDLCRDLGWKAALDPDTATRADISAAGDRLLGDPAAELEKLANKIAAMRVRAEDNRIALDALMGAMRGVGMQTWMRHAAGRVGQKLGVGVR
jgi:polysaccharide pyruvyl transferase WcaK-like protein